MSEEQKLLTVEQVAEQLHVGQITVRRMLWKKLLPAVRLGHNTVRVRQADLDAFIASRVEHAKA